MYELCVGVPSSVLMNVAVHVHKCASHGIAHSWPAWPLGKPGVEAGVLGLRCKRSDAGTRNCPSFYLLHL